MKTANLDAQAAVARRLAERAERSRALVLEGRRDPGADVLVIGDRPSPGADPAADYHVPFGEPTGCSIWLNAALEAAGIPEAALTWVNAYDLAGRPTDHGVLTLGWTPPPRGEGRSFVPATRREPVRGQWRQVIALGEFAEAWLAARPASAADAVGFPWATAHPQSWKRFRHHRPYPLVEFLAELLNPDVAR